MNNLLRIKQKQELPGVEDDMQRAGEPFELAPAYVYLASNIDSSYVTGQILHVNGGKIVNG